MVVVALIQQSLLSCQRACLQVAEAEAEAAACQFNTADIREDRLRYTEWSLVHCKRLGTCLGNLHEAFSSVCMQAFSTRFQDNHMLLVFECSPWLVLWSHHSLSTHTILHMRAA